MNNTINFDTSASPCAAVDFAEPATIQMPQSFQDERGFMTNVVKKTSVNMFASINAVAFYQPFRTWANQLVRQIPVSFKPTDMYKGFIPQMFTSHQLMVMGLSSDIFNHYVFGKESSDQNFWERFIKGSVAGIVSAPSVTPFEMMNVQMQSHPDSPLAQVWRKVMQSPDATIKFKGFFPTAMRNWGIGIGMFCVPEEVKKIGRNFISQDWIDNHSVAWNALSNFVGGIVGTVITQIPDMARVKMQSDKEGRYSSARMAIAESAREVATPTAMKAFMCRMGIVGVATVVMMESRKQFDGMVNNASKP